MSNFNSKKSEGINTINSSFRPAFVKGADIVFLKQDERGKFYLLRNPRNLKYLRINEPAYDVIQMFDGNTPLNDIERKINEQNIKLDAYEFAEFLAERGFIENLNLQNETLKRKTTIDALTTIKYPFVQADSAFALSFYRLYSLALSKIFLVVYLALCGGALLLFLGNLPVILDDAFSTLHPDTPVAPLIIAFVVFYAVDFMHEVAHAGVFYNLGGIPKKIGFTFHYFIPFFFTDVPDVRLFTSKRSILVFLAGPFSTLFFGLLWIALYFVEPTFKTAWAMLAVGCYASVMFTLAPFVKTDGYYIIETLLKFPNLHTHALRNIKNHIKYALKILPKERFRQFRASYSKSERTALDIYSLFLPIGMATMISLGALLALAKAFPNVLAGVVQILVAPATATPKAYLSLLITLFFTIELSYGIVITLWSLLRWRSQNTDS